MTTSYTDMTTEELLDLKSKLETKYSIYQEMKMELNMARGKPGDDQLDLSIPMLGILQTREDCVSENGTGCRNYGIVDGLPEAKRMMAFMLDDDPRDVIVFGNSSLNIMYDTMMRIYAFGTQGHEPWCKLDKVKWLCPAPGYDRHFGITETFGFEMITIPMLEDGPDMDMVEELVKNDASIKGIWCIPKYSNPTGIVFSDEVVDRLAKMECAAPDFRIFWDNAYCIHYLYEEPEMQDTLKDIGEACRAYGNDERYLKFASTSKVTLPGSGVSAMAACTSNINEVRKAMTVQTIGHDKLNQLRHVKFLEDEEHMMAHMYKHAAIIRPKFEKVCEMLELGLQGTGATWHKPRGGYFVSFMGYPGTAKRTVQLAKDCGVTMTGAGATYPYKNDPKDSNIRIAPTLPPLFELEAAMKVFIVCNKIATCEAILAERA